MKRFFSWFYHLRTSTKLLSAFIAIAILQMGVGLLSLSNMEKLNSNVGSMYHENLKPMEYMNETRNLFQELKVNWRDIFITPSARERESLQENIKRVRGEIQKNIDLYKTTDLTNEQRELLENFEILLSQYNREFDRSIEVIIKNDTKYFNQTNLTKLQIELGVIINKLVDVNAKQAEQANKNANHTYTTMKAVTAVNIIFTFLLCLAFGFFIARVISKPLKQVAGLVEKVAEGDLTETSPIRTRDEVGHLAHSVNKMIFNLRGMIENIRRAAENLSASSEQVSASTAEIASASTNQANAAQTMNELFRELSDVIQTVALNTEQAAKLSKEAMQMAEEGGKIVLSSVEGAQLVSGQMSKMEGDSNKIGEIIGVIDDIADQTNLLALNAAIEAARAGEHGRGFAVVADEVRKLAERSVEATKQITDIIKGIQDNTKLSVRAVEEGAAFTQKSGEAFEHIIRMVNETGKKVTEIAGASEQQAAQSAEVLSFIESISAATEEATASSQETASTAQALTELAAELNHSVSNFKLALSD